jgi:Protein of unknown function (DUF2510)
VSTSPGWYPDRAAPQVLRWWDGMQWTGHTRTPAAEAIANHYTASTPPMRNRRGLKMVGAFCALAVVVVAIVAPVFLKRGQPRLTCGTVATPGMSSQASAYVRVVQKFYAMSGAYTQKVNANNSGGTASTASDYRAELKIESTYLAGLRSIAFTGVAAGDAVQLEAADSTTIADLQVAMTADTPQVDAQLKADYANESAAQLRTDLGLPPHGTCSFWQPL